MRRQHAAQGAGGQGDEDQLAGLEGRQQIVDRLDPGMQLDALEVARVLAVGTHGFGLLGVAHPLPHPNAVFRQQIRHGGAETPASQNCNRLLFSHIQSVKTN
ncbi:hypothetical protein D3C81_1397840 [compost metagenome]